MSEIQSDRPANKMPRTVFFETLVTGTSETMQLCRTEGRFLRSLLTRSNEFELAEAPEHAELCLLYTPSYQFRGGIDRQRSKLMQSLSCTKAPYRTAVLNLEDRPLFRFPTLTPSLTRKSSVAAPVPYVHYLKDARPLAANEAATKLASFVGDSSTHRVRNRLIKLCHQMGWLARNTPTRWPTEPADRANFRNHYFDSIASSRFVLCPRGVSPSTIRVFEVLRAGRVPVIISDAFVPPGPCDWRDFALFVAEKDIASIPKLLDSSNRRFEIMAARARQAWEAHFGPEAIGRHLISAANQLIRSSVRANRIDYLFENVERVVSGESRLRCFVRQSAYRAANQSLPSALRAARSA